MDDLTQAGEFSIDLYTMPELLSTKLWDHLVSLPFLENRMAGAVY